MLFIVLGRLKEPGVMMVVAPFWALVNDQVDRLKVGINWANRETNTAAIMVVSADVTWSEAFWPALRCWRR